MAGTAVTLEHVGKTFADGTTAVLPLDLCVHPGELLGLVGPSGCGKTTTLRMIAGLESPDPGGRVLFDGVDVTRVPVERRNIGMVFQSYALFPNMTVAANVAYGLRARGVDRAERADRVAEMLALVHLEKLADRSPDQLSGGQRQRVALARALAIRPRVLLLDEPLTALDAKLRESLRVEMDRLLRGLGITTIFVTHDQAEAMSLGDRIAVMHRGRIAQIGTPREVYRNPADPFVADFIGTVNRLIGQVRDGMLLVEGGRLPFSGNANGQPCEVLYRPQDATLCEPGSGDLEGRVENVFFLGDRTRLVLSAAWGEAVVDTSRPLTAAKGDRIGLRIPAESLYRCP